MSRSSCLLSLIGRLCVTIIFCLFLFSLHEFICFSAGLLHAQDGDMVFARPIGGEMDGANDSLQLMAFGEYVDFLWTALFV